MFCNAAVIMLAILTSRVPAGVLVDGLAVGCQGTAGFVIGGCRSTLMNGPGARDILRYEASVLMLPSNLLRKNRKISQKSSAACCRLNLQCRFASSSKEKTLHQSKQSDWDFFMPEERFDRTQRDSRQSSNQKGFRVKNNLQVEKERENTNGGAWSSSQDRPFVDRNGRSTRTQRAGSKFDRSRSNRREGSEETKRWNKRDDIGRINLREIQDSGYEHLYGIAPILNALVSNERDFSPANISIETDIKPEAQLTPYLFIQDQGKSARDSTKRKSVNEIQSWAARRGVPIAHIDKGDLNTLSGNRPHQGLVLRCGRLNTLEENVIAELPYPDDAAPAVPKLWLALDEVVDPQNFGALLRSAYFLGSGDDSEPKVGVLVCSKNSSPPSPVASASSAGALELASDMLYSTNNLPRTLQRAREDGWNIMGAAALVPNDSGEDGHEIKCVDLQDIGMHGDIGPTLLVLGSEGHGLRKVVSRQCTSFVRIPRGYGSTLDLSNRDEDDETSNNASSHGVDSLNVSVTGGIMLWHLLQKISR